MQMNYNLPSQQAQAMRHNQKADQHQIDAIHQHWHTSRNTWLGDHQEDENVREGMEYAKLPEDIQRLEQLKKDIISTKLPYPVFDNYYRLSEIVGLYEEVWFEDQNEMI